MTVDGSGPGDRNKPGSVSQRNVLIPLAAMLGSVAGGVSMGIGAGRMQAIGITLLVFGATLWFGGMRGAAAAQVLDERTRRQRYRSRAIALALGGLVAIFYVATLVRLGPNVLNKDGFATIGAKKNIVIEDKSQDLAACKKAGTC